MMNEKLHMNIDSELKTQLKVIAARKHTTMSDIIIELITEYVEENK